MEFSPDGHYFVASWGEGDFAYDLQLKRTVSLPGRIRNVLRNSFAFLGPDRIVGINPVSPQKSPVLRFPGGERLLELPLSNSVHLTSTAHRDFVMVGPLHEKALGMLAINDTQRFAATFERDAGEIYDNWITSERKDGQLSLLDLAQKKRSSFQPMKQFASGEDDTAWVLN